LATDHGWWSRYVAPRTGAGLQHFAGYAARPVLSETAITERHQSVLRATKMGGRRRTVESEPMPRSFL
jgi:hypothetical protein